MSLIPDHFDKNKIKELERRKRNPLDYDSNHDINFAEKPAETTGDKTGTLTLPKRK